MRIIFHKKRGFNLIEALVAVSIFAFVVIVPLSIASQSLLVASSANDQMVAVGLARDVIEYVNYVRLENSTTPGNTNSWLYGIMKTPGPNTDLCVASIGCRIDTSVSPATINLHGGEKLRYDSTSGLYGYNSLWPESKFTRTVWVTGVDNLTDPQRQAIVKVEVTWQSTNGATRSVFMTQYFFNWVPEEK
jgi:type II secretory pathway pseudopilin PulG